MKKYDEFAFLKYIMSIMLIICHFNILVGMGFSYNNKILNEMLFIGATYGGRTPIIFFGISGILTYRVYRKSIVEEFSSFISKRFANFFPMIMISVVWITAVQYVYYYHYNLWWNTRDNGLENIVLALTGINVGGLINRPDTMNGPLWYISVLLICYGAFYIVQRLSAFIPEHMLYVLMVLIGISIDDYNINLPFFNHYTMIGYVGFFLGSLLEKCYYDFDLNLHKKMNLCAGLVVSFLTVAVFVFGRRFNAVAGEGILWIGMVILPILYIGSQCFQKVLKNPLFDYCGKLSVPIFFFHIPTIEMIDSVNQMTGMGENVFWVIIIVHLESIIFLFIKRRIRGKK